MYLWHLKLAVESSLPQVLRDYARRQAQLDVQIGSVRLDLTRIQAWDASVRFLDGKPLLKTPYLALHFPDGTTPLRLEVARPQLWLTRDHEGRWNIDPLLKQPPPEEPLRLAYEMVAEEGTLWFEDTYPKTPVRQQVALRSVRLVQPLQAQSLRAEAFAPDTGMLIADALSDGRRWVVDVQVERLKWNLARSYLPESEFTVRDGWLKGQVRIVYEPEKPLQLVGSGQGYAQGLAFRKGNLPWQGAQFEIGFTESGLVGRAVSERREVVVWGSVDWSRSPIVFSAQVAASGNDARALWRLVRRDESLLKGAYRLRLRAEGTVDNPQAIGEAFLERIETPEGAIRNLRADLIFANRQLWVPTVEAEFAQATVNGKVYLDLRPKEPHYTLALSIPKLRVEQVPALRERGLAGELFVQALGSGTLEQPTLTANLLSSQVRYNGTALGVLRARADYRAGKVEIPWGALQGALGTVIASGIVEWQAEESSQSPQPRIDFLIEGSELELNRIAELMGYTEGALGADETGKPLRLDGVGYATLQIRGTLQEPEMVGDIAVFDGRWGDIGAEIVAGSFNLLEKRVLIPEVRILRRSAEVIASGQIDLPPQSDQPLRFRAQAQAKDLDLTTLSDWTRLDFPIAGLANAELTAEGTPERFTITGTAFAQKAQFDQVLTDRSEVAFRFEREGDTLHLWVEDARIEAGGVLTGSGEWRSDGTLRAQWHLEQLPIVRIATYLPPEYRLEGAFSVSGSVEGTLESPVLQAQFSTKPLSLNRVAVGTLTGQLTSQGGKHWQGALTLNAPEGTIQLTNAQFDTESRTLTGEGTLRDLSVGWLRQLVSALPLKVSPEISERLQTIEGRLGAEFQVAGTPETPQVRLIARAEDLRWRDQPLGTLSAQASWLGQENQSQLIEVTQLVWHAETTRLEGRFRWQPDQLDADVELSQFPIQWVRLWDQSLPQVEGTLDLSLIATGDPEKPDLNLTASVRNLKYEDYTVDQLLFSQIEVSEGAIRTDDALIRMRNYEARLSGRLPFRWSEFTIPREEPLEVQLRLREQPLSILELALPIDKERTEGTLDALLSLEGTLENIQPRGTVVVRGGKVAVEGFETALQELGLRLEFDGQQAQLVEARASSSEGGTLNLTGTIDFREETPALALRGTLNGFTVQEPKLPFGGSTLTSISGDVRVDGSYKNPLVQAELQVPKGFLYLPAEFAPREEPSPLPFNPRLAVRVAVREGFTLRNPNLDAQMEGILEVRGTVQEPLVEGTFNLKGGALNLPTARLRIEPESVVRLNYPVTTLAGETIARIDLDVRANTTVVAPDLTGDPLRYRVEVGVRGALDDPEKLQLTARSDPPGLSEQRILSLLGRGTALAALAQGADPAQVFREQISDILTAQVLPSLLMPLETELAEAFDLEQFAIDYSGLRPTSIYLVKNLFDGVGITYRRSVAVGQREAYEVRLFYRLPFRYPLLQRLRIGVGFDHTQNRFVFIEGSVLFR